MLAIPIVPNAYSDGADFAMYPFEEDVNGWRPGAGADSQAITEVVHDATRAYLGRGSIRATVELIPGHQSKSKGEVGVDMGQDPPPNALMFPPYDLSEAVIFVAVRLPKEAVGSPQAPNGLQIFLKDSRGRAKYGRWINLTDVPTDDWYQLAIDVANEPWGWDGGADLTDITEVGIKIGASEAPLAHGFSGDIWIDSFTWAKPSLDFRGMSYTAWSAEEYKTSDSDASLYRLKGTGANYVALIVTGYMEDGSSTAIGFDPVKTPSDESLIHAMEVAHSYGLRVFLKPHVDCKDGTWRGEISPEDAAGWFASYRQFITHYAKIAEEHSASLFCVGTEFRSLSGADYRSFWQDVIEGIRAVYGGPITYAANWDEYQRVSFWDLVDYAGIDAYFPLSEQKTPSVDELVGGWQGWVSAVETWQRGIGKRVIFTELGYRSIDFPAKEPWSWMHEAIYNEEAQANCYQAAFQALEGRPWFAGMFWWNWLPDQGAGGPGDTDYTPQNKRAQEVLTQHQGERSITLFDFEDGTPQGWTKALWKEAFLAAPAGSTAMAYQGTWALAFPLSLSEKIDDAGSIVRNMNFSPYDAFSLFLYVPPDADIDWMGGVAFIKVGPNWTWHQGEWINFRPGAWNKLTMELTGIEGLNFVREVGFLIGGAGRGETTIYIDQVVLTKELVADTTPPAPPAGITVTPIRQGTLLLTWANPEDPDFSHVRIYRSTVFGELGDLIQDGVTETFVLDSDLAVGSTYYYTLSSVDLSGNESAGTDQVAGTSAALWNLALGKTAMAQSNEEPSQWYAGEPSYVCDGDLKTRWSSEYSDPQWIYVDLGAVHEIQKVVVFWETAYAKAYEIQVSLDAQAWITVFSTTEGDGGADVVAFDPVPARYVRVYGTQRGTSYGYSLLELEVY